MTEQLLQASSVPEKFPLYQSATIICDSCKERYRLSRTTFNSGRTVDSLSCPHCHSFIDICNADDAALTTRGQGSGIGDFPFTLAIPFNFSSQPFEVTK